MKIPLQVYEGDTFNHLAFKNVQNNLI